MAADKSFIDLSRGETPEFKESAMKARADAALVMRHIEQGDDDVYVLVFLCEENHPKYAWCKIDQQATQDIGQPSFTLIEQHPDWQVFQVGQPMTQDLSLIYDYKIVDGSQILGNYTQAVLAEMNSYY